MFRVKWVSLDLRNAIEQKLQLNRLVWGSLQLTGSATVCTRHSSSAPGTRLNVASFRKKKNGESSYRVHGLPSVSQANPNADRFSITHGDTESDPHLGWLGLACETRSIKLVELFKVKSRYIFSSIREWHHSQREEGLAKGMAGGLRLGGPSHDYKLWCLM